MRIKFQKGKQKEFIEKVIVNLGCPSLSELVNRGIETKISSLKNYYSERRTLPENLFYDLCEISGFDKNSFSFNFIENNWGQKKGGRKSKRNGPARN